MDLPNFKTETYIYFAVGLTIGIILYKLFTYIITPGDDGENAKDGPLTEVPIQNLKMVLVVRTDLKMQKGKIGAQCGHATLGAYKKSRSKKSKYWRKCFNTWQAEAHAKVCLKTDSEESLLEIYKQAKKNHLPAYLVTDAGRTQIAAGSHTVVGIGPAPSELIDPITGDLKLL
ncbi:unnamed protein product [Moneuplotes crassus]|uniref:peptidyl-tRNA hydrolase n=1 Tax=Euplotes crassus TaxID=5936 RepID=A0AAD1Y346_EUPCR|nr:unnamed protein product [Moneuplotes crassus]